MTVSIIIPNLHSPLIGAVLDALRAQTALDHIREIIVVGVDNTGLVRADHLVRVIDTGRPVSAAVARNRGAEHARGDFLLFVDADCLLARDALEHLLGAAGDGYGALVGGVVPETGRYWVLASNLMTFPGYLTLDAPGERDCLPSFCLVVPRAVWQQVGPFAERYHGASAEDLDLSFRMRQAGLRLGCTPLAAVRHRPDRNNLGAIWRQHIGFGVAWLDIYHRYRTFMPFSEAIWLCEKVGGPLAAAALVPLAVLYVLRLLAQRPALRRFWFAAPGMVWAQLAWYNGMLRAAEAAQATHSTPQLDTPGAAPGRSF